MTFNFSKTLMVLLICLTFVGQAMASAVMPYHMISMGEMNAQEQSADMSKMDNSGHNMASDTVADDSENSTEDCCVKTCSCFTGGCSSVSALIKNVSTESVGDFSSKINSFSSLAKSQQLPSLYRPPILS